MDFTAVNRIDTSTIYKLVAKTVDTIITHSPFTMMILGSQKKWTGSQIKVPIKYQKNSKGMSYSGLEKFSTEQSDNFINMKFDPTGREIPCVISGIEADINASAKSLAPGMWTDLVKRQLESDADDMADDIADLFFTLQTGKNFLSLVDAYDDGTIGATSYGSLLRSAYTGVQGNYTNIAGNLTLAAMRSQMNSCTHGKKRPSLIITTEAVWGYYEKLLTPTVETSIRQAEIRASEGYAQLTAGGKVVPAGGLKGEQGFNTIYYSGVPLVADEHCNSGYMYWIRPEDVIFYGLTPTLEGYTSISFNQGQNIDGIYGAVPRTPGFGFSGFLKPIDQYGKIGHIILQGNLVCRDPRNGGILIGITGA